MKSAPPCSLSLGGALLGALAFGIGLYGCGGEPEPSTIDADEDPEPVATSTPTATGTATATMTATATATAPPAPSLSHLAGCFTHSDGFATCSTYCESVGRQCAESSCNGDGTLIENGYTWVSWPATERAECDALGYPRQMSFDACTTPIWLTPTKARDDVVRCCCQ